ncbi:MAG: hypothetical protein LAT81_16940, partial [Oceanicaulis sp.]|nr:hypothetical protein [Oceanicaulis sp.]
MHTKYIFKSLVLILSLFIVQFFSTGCNRAISEGDRVLFGLSELFGGGGERRGGVKLIADESPFVYEGGTTNVQVVLTLRPSAEVTVPVISGDTAQATIDKSELSFTPDNWDVPQNIAITGVLDGIADGNKEVDLIFNSLISTDPKFEALTVDNWPFVVLDINQYSVAVFPRNLTTREVGTTDGSSDGENGIGTTAVFWVAISGDPAPTNDVIIDPLTSANTQEGTLDRTSLTFTPANWNTPQKVTVNAVDDGVEDGNKNYLVTLADTASDDTSYNGLSADSVSVTNLDSQASNPGDSTVASILVSPTTINLIEPVIGGVAGFVASDFCDIDVVALGQCAGFGHFTGEFVVRLSSDPGAQTVTVPITSPEPGRATVNPNSITFDSSNWNSTTHGRVKVTAINTTVQDPETPVNISIGTSSSGNPVFNNLQGVPVRVNITDLHRPAILVSNMSRDTQEPQNATTVGQTSGGVDANFTVVFTVPAQAGQTVTLGFDDLFDSRNVGHREGEITTPASKQLVLTDAATLANQRQTVTITPKADLEVDGNKQWTVRTLNAVASNGNASLYHNIKPRDVTVTNIDRDVQGIRVAINNGSWTNLNTTSNGIRDFNGMATDESNRFAGTYSNIRIRLRTIPAHPVTINLSNSNTDISELSDTSHTFDNTNWNDPFTVIVTGRSSSAHGTTSYTISSTLNSSDTNYTNSGTQRPRFNLRSCDNDANDVTWCSLSGGSNMTS